MNKINLKLLIAIGRTQKKIFSLIETSLLEYDLNLSEFGVLELLLHKGEQKVQVLADKILVTSGTITYVVNKLQDKNLVYKKNSETDKRVFMVGLTQSGESLIKKAFENHEVFIEKMFCNLDKKTKQNLTEELFNLLNSTDNQTKKGDD